MRTRRSPECDVAIIHSGFHDDDLDMLKELSKEYPPDYIGIYAEDSRIAQQANCRIPVICETDLSPSEVQPSLPMFPCQRFTIIVEERNGEESEVYEYIDDFLDGLRDIIRRNKSVSATDSDRESEGETSLDQDPEEKRKTTIRPRSAGQRGTKSPQKRDEQTAATIKGRRELKSRTSDTDSPRISKPAMARTLGRDSESEMVDKQQKRRDIHLILFFAILAIFCFPIYFIMPEETIRKPLLERYREQLEQLKLSHHKQDSRLWRVTNATMKTHIIDNDPRQPAVLMLASSSQTSVTREGLARKIATIYSMRCNESDFVKINGAAYSSFDHATAKERLDTTILSGFEAGSCAVIVSNFQELPPASTAVFYQFCENDYAPNKKALILFTTEVSDWDWMGDDRSRFLSEDKIPKPQFWSRVIESYLQYSLQHNDDSGKMTADMIGGLLTRITPLVAWVGEE